VVCGGAVGDCGGVGAARCAPPLEIA